MLIYSNKSILLLLLHSTFYFTMLCAWSSNINISNRLFSKISSFATLRSINSQHLQYRYSSSSHRLYSSNKDDGIDSIAKNYVLQYQYVENMMEKRQPYRAKHLELVINLMQNNQCLQAGALGNAEGGLFSFFCTKDVIQSFVDQDPYVSNKLVTNWTIQEWNLVSKP